MLSKFNYLGACFNDEGGEDGGNGNDGGNTQKQPDIKSILSNRELMAQILENSNEYKTAREQASQANQKLTEAQRKQRRGGRKVHVSEGGS